MRSIWFTTLAAEYIKVPFWCLKIGTHRSAASSSWNVNSRTLKSQFYGSEKRRRSFSCHFLTFFGCRFFISSFGSMKIRAQTAQMCHVKLQSRRFQSVAATRVIAPISVSPLLYPPALSWKHLSTYMETVEAGRGAGGSWDVGYL